MNFRGWWFLGCCLAFGLQGVAVAVFGSPDPFGIYVTMIQQHFFGGQIPPQAEALRLFLLAPLGGTLAGYFVLLFYCGRRFFRAGDRAAGHFALGGVLTWLVVDSAMCAWHGVWFNIAVVNLPAGAALLTPLVWELARRP